MPGLIYTTANLPADLQGILDLQRANLAVNLSAEEVAREGFVTVVHTLDLLARLNGREPHVIAKHGDKVVAYLLAMTRESKDLVPVLVPMFNLFDETLYRSQPVSKLDYLVVGQVCVGKGYRGQGVLDRCYDLYRSLYSGAYDCAVTEIDASNARSLNAHRRIGFEEIRRYRAPDGVEWSIVLWDWKE
jgi:ribosomal protein S18 acetylase RimI-like enzyme